MIQLTKQNLYYSDYSWTDYFPNNPKVSGKLDATRFDKYEGNEILYLINKIIELWDFQKIESAIKIERIIREKLPNKINTQEEIATWIQLNWKTIEFKITA